MYQSSEDLTKAKDPSKKHKPSQAERDALKADIRKRIQENKNMDVNGTEHSSSDEDFEIYETHASQQSQTAGKSNFTFVSMLTNILSVDPERTKILENFGYPTDYISYAVSENEANYCVAAYYLLAIDQNY